MSDKKFLIPLLVISLIVRIIFDIIYVYPPEVPHDFYAYIGAGKAFLSNTLYHNMDSQYGSRYGVILAATMAVTLKLFGENFILIKIPSTIADVSTIVVFYYIVKNLIGVNQAKYAAIFYAFSYLTLSNVMEGQDDHFFILFMLLSLYYILNQKVMTSAFFIFVSIGFKPSGIALVLPTLYYIYKIINVKSSMKYVGIVIVLTLLMLIPYGTNAFLVYSPGGTILRENMLPIGSNYFSLYHYLDYYFNYGINSSYLDYVTPVKALAPFSILGFILLFCYFFVYRLKNHEIELIRNTFMIMFVGIMLAVLGDVHFIFWYLPFLLILFINSVKAKFSDFKINTKEIIGICFILYGIFINASMYRWDFVPYTTFDRFVILSGSLMAGIGTLLLLNKLPQKYCLSIIIFWYAVELQLHSYILKAFSFIFPILAERHYAWGILSFITNVMMVFALTWLFILVHKVTKKA